MRTTMRSPRGSTLAMTLGLLAGVVMAAPLAAQDDDDDDHRGGGRGFFQAGLMQLDLGELNSSLAGAGFPELEEGFLTLGGAGYGNAGRFLIGGEGHSLVTTDEVTAGGGTEVSLGGGYGLFRVGYLVHDKGGFEVYPTLGIGGGGMELRLTDRSAPTFDDVLADPARSSSLSVGMFLMDVGLVANYRFSGERDEDSGDEGGFLLGVQAGYTFAPGDPEWRLDDINNVAGGPRLAIEGLYLRFSLGGWGREGS